MVSFKSYLQNNTVHPSSGSLLIITSVIIFIQQFGRRNIESVLRLLNNKNLVQEVTSALYSKMKICGQDKKGMRNTF